jgi:glucan-binding YG repeat protein
LAFFRKKAQPKAEEEKVETIQEQPEPQISEDEEEGIEAMDEQTVLFSATKPEDAAYSLDELEDEILENEDTLSFTNQTEQTLKMNSVQLDKLAQMDEPVIHETKQPAQEIEEFLEQNQIEGMKDGKLYDNGVPQYGELEVNGFVYYFDPKQDGHTASGLTFVPAHYAADNQDKTIFCSMKGNLMYGPLTVEGDERFFLEGSGAMACSQLVTWNEKMYYYDAFGLRYRGQIVLDGKHKYFDEATGEMRTGIVTIPAGMNDGTEKTVCFDDNGDMLFGLIEQDGKTRGFDLWDGHMMTGLTSLSSEYGPARIVYFDEDGIMATGDVQINDVHMYFAKNGRMITNSTVRIDEQLFYYDQKGHRYHGPRYLRGKWKYFDENDGHMLTGFLNLPDENQPSGFKTVYYNEKGDMLFGQQEIGGHTMCFDLYDGHMFKGLTYLSYEYGGPRTVYFDENGHMVYGSVLVNDHYMYFDKKGDMARSTMVRIDDETYYYDDSGFRYYGQKFIGGNWKYFDQISGAMRTGLVELDENVEPRGAKTVLYDANGNMLCGLQKVNGRYRFFDYWDGHMTTGLVHVNDEKKGLLTLYFDENGQMVYGPTIINGKEMFFFGEGGQVSNTLVEYENEVFYYDQNGCKHKGLQKINGKWKYFDACTGAMVHGLVKLQDETDWQNEKTCYFDEEGNMVYGLKEIDGKVKCFDLQSGAMKKGLTHLSADYGESKTVYFDEEGNMVYGVQEIDGKRCIFDAHTGALLHKPGTIYEFASADEIIPDQVMKKNALAIACILKDNKWSLQAIAGLLAVMQQRSKIDPAAQNGSLYGLFLQKKDESMNAWMEQNGLEYESGAAQIERLMHEMKNGLNWKKAEAYPITFKEYAALEFKPGYAAQSFYANYIDEPIENAEELSQNALVWHNYLKEHEF